jgi:hypothetical protein
MSVTFLLKEAFSLECLFSIFRELWSNEMCWFMIFKWKIWTLDFTFNNFKDDFWFSFEINWSLCSIIVCFDGIYPNSFEIQAQIFITIQKSWLLHIVKDWLYKMKHELSKNTIDYFKAFPSSMNLLNNLANKYLFSHYILFHLKLSITH